ncbi:MAG: hypothetical protein LBL52_04530, partial [Rickettsiales bacterium]|nr:hypothetical protein [Rickettsiales bacterium]
LSYGFIGIAAFDQSSFYEFDDFGDFFYDQYDDLLYVEGGSIDSQAIGMNIFIPLGDFIGSLFDGTITPYIGAGFGVSYNKVADYYVYDEMGFAEVPLDDSGLPFDPEYFDDLSGYYEWDGWLTHFGATTKSTMWNLELGVEVSVNKKTKLDFYVKQSSFGIVKSKGDVEATYEATSILYPDPEEVDEFGEPLCTLDAEDEGYWYNPDTGWCELDLGPSTTYINDAPPEEGRIQNTEMGVRLRVIF